MMYLGFVFHVVNTSELLHHLYELHQTSITGRNSYIELCEPACRNLLALPSIHLVIFFNNLRSFTLLHVVIGHPDTTILPYVEL